MVARSASIRSVRDHFVLIGVHHRFELPRSVAPTDRGQVTRNKSMNPNQYPGIYGKPVLMTGARNGFGLAMARALVSAGGK
jgi:hypothetical protein